MKSRFKRLPPGRCASAVSAMILTAAIAQPGLAANTTTPIEHVVVIFQENVSFDHYFATYPQAVNPSGEPKFSARDDTPAVNGLGTLVDGQPEGALLTDNPNTRNAANGSNAINPFRFDRSQASTCDQDHNYGDEQKAFDQGSDGASASARTPSAPRNLPMAKTRAW